MPCGLVLFNSNSNFDFACNQPVSRKKVLFKDVCANFFWASLHANSHAMSCMHWAHMLSTKMNIVSWAVLMAIAIYSFAWINDLGCSVNPTFLFRNRFCLQLHVSPHCPKLDKKSIWEGKKNSRFLSVRHQILPSCVAARHMKLWSLNANFMLHAKSFCYCSVLFFRCCCFCCSLRNQLTKFA